MKILRPAILATAALLACVSCKKDSFEEQKDVTSKIKLSVSLGGMTKAALDSARTAWCWEDDDEISVLNDKESQNLRLKVGDTPCEAEVTAGATKVYGITPYKSYYTKGPATVNLSIPYAQTQTAGSLNGNLWPMWAASTVTEGKAELVFRPLAAAFALNVWRSDGNAGGEALKSVKVTPLHNSGFVGNATVDLSADAPAYTKGNSSSSFIIVTLDEPCPLAGEEPDARGCDGQIYAVAARTAYKGIRFEITTDKGAYTVSTDENFSYDLSSKDLIITGIDLSALSVTAYIDNGGTLTPVDITRKGGASLDDPRAYQEEAVDHDVIPDFSRVGYKYGDEPIPSYPVRKTLSPDDIAGLLASGSYPDTTACIQAAIDEVGGSGGGALLLKEGTYHTHGTLFIDHDNTVVRGEGKDKTVVISDEKRKMATFFIGRSVASDSTTPDSLKFAGRKLGRSTLRCADQYNNFGDYYLVYFTPSVPGTTYGHSVAISEDYVPVGRLYLEVEDVSVFAPGDRISVFRPHNDDWISDIGMDKIAMNGRECINSGTKQWNTLNFAAYWQRKVTGIRGNRIYIDAPVVQAIDASYGGGLVYKITVNRVTGSGVENMTIKTTVYRNTSDPDSYYNKRWIDENHSWYAVMTKAAEHCWIKDVDSYWYGMSLASLGSGSRNITVENCKCMEPVSIVNGGRRYAFNISGAELCLVKDCLSDEDRHAFITNVSRGPNVFLRCTTTNFSGSIGPHQHWGTGDLFDNVSTAGNMEAYDRGNAGTGHGWAGANYVYWNCTAHQMTMQSPWARENTPELETMPGGYVFHSAHASARNYCIGFTGARKKVMGTSYEKPYSSKYSSEGIFDYYVKLGFDGSSKLTRPAAQWYPMIEPGASGSTKVMLPDATAAATYDWWPSFTLTSFSHPESLYECLLEERHYRGIYLNNL